MSIILIFCIRLMHDLFHWFVLFIYSFVKKSKLGVYTKVKQMKKIQWTLESKGEVFCTCYRSLLFPTQGNHQPMTMQPVLPHCLPFASTQPSTLRSAGPFDQTSNQHKHAWSDISTHELNIYNVQGK